MGFKNRKVVTANGILIRVENPPAYITREMLKDACDTGKQRILGWKNRISWGDLLLRAAVGRILYSDVTWGMRNLRLTGSVSSIYETMYYLEGKRHRERGPAYVSSSGTIEYRQHGQLHRVDGPARMLANRIEYWVHGTLHRDDGPAVVYFSGEQYFYKDGVKCAPF